MLIVVLLFFYIGCGENKNDEPQQNKDSAEPQYITNSTGIGPVEKVELGPIDQNLVMLGEQIFNSKCIACHTLDEKRLGPPLGDVTQKLRPEFIMNYLLNTHEMQEKDEYLKNLVKEYHILMPDQGLSESQARSVLEYLRSSAK